MREMWVPKTVTGRKRPRDLSRNHPWILTGHCHLVQPAYLTTLKNIHLLCHQPCFNVAAVCL